MFCVLLLLLVCCTFGVHADVRDEFIDEITGDASISTGDDSDELDAEGFMEAIAYGLIDSQFSSFDVNADGGIDDNELNTFKNIIPTDSRLYHHLQIVNYDLNRDMKLDIDELKMMVKNHLEEFMTAIQTYFQQMTGGAAEHEEL